MYGPDHKRTEAQFETAWNELQQGLPAAGEGGFLLGVSDNKLLLDGVPLEAGQTEKSFGQLLSTAGLASLHFSKEVTVGTSPVWCGPLRWPAQRPRMYPSKSKKL